MYYSNIIIICKLILYANYIICKHVKKTWLQGNDTEIYSTHNEENSVVAERSIRTLKKKICKYMAVY